MLILRPHSSGFLPTIFGSFLFIFRRFGHFEPFSTSGGPEKMTLKTRGRLTFRPRHYTLHFFVRNWCDFMKKKKPLCTFVHHTLSLAAYDCMTTTPPPAHRPQVKFFPSIAPAILSIIQNTCSLITAPCAPGRRGNGKCFGRFHQGAWCHGADSNTPHGAHTTPSMCWMCVWDHPH